jgi:hypothetical protein
VRRHVVLALATLIACAGCTVTRDQTAGASSVGTVQPSPPTPTGMPPTNRTSATGSSHPSADTGSSGKEASPTGSFASFQTCMTAAKSPTEQQACMKKLQSALGPSTVSPTQAALNAFAACMRREGVTVQPDLQVIKYLDRTNPTTAHAYANCKAKLPPAATG